MGAGREMAGSQKYVPSSVFKDIEKKRKYNKY
jgi:hypothetical protein